MPAIFKTYLSLLLLTVFLIPCIEKEVHGLEHLAEKHCGEKTTTHFHELHHQCEICDYTISDLFSPNYFDHGTGFVPCHKTDQVSYSASFVTTHFLSFSLRGPPIFS